MAEGESLRRRATWVSLGRLSNAAALLLVNVFLARALPDADVGSFQKVWVLLTVWVPLFVFGLPLAMSYFGPTLPTAERGRFLAQQVLLSWLSAALFAAAVLLGAETVARYQGDPHLAVLLRLAVPLGTALIATGFWEPLLIVYGRHRWLAVSLAVFSLLHVTAVVLGWLVSGSVRGIYVALGAYAALRFAVCAAGLVHVARPLPLGWRGDWLRQQVRYALPLGLRDGIGAVSRATDKLIASFRVSAEQFGYYVYGALELPLIGLVVDATLAVLLPELAGAHQRGERARVVELMRLAARRIGLLVFPVCVLSLVVAEPLMALLFGGAYRQSAPYFRVFALLLLCRVSTSGTVLMAAGRPGLVLVGSVLDMVLAAGLGLALLPRLGLIGLAVGLLVSTYCQVAYYLYQAARVLGEPMRRLVPWLDLARLLLVSAAAGAAAALSARFDAALPNLAAMGLCFALVFLGAGYFGRGFGADERAAVRRAARAVGALAGGR